MKPYGDHITVGGQEYAVARSTIRDLKRVDQSALPESVQGVNRAVASAMHQMRNDTPDMTWVQFIIDVEGANANRDYMPRPALMKNFASVKWKPFDMDHVIIEDESMVGMDVEKPPVRNSIYGVMSHAALSWANGTLLTQDEIKNLDDTDVMNRPDDQRLACTAWAGLYHFLFPKTVADVTEMIDNGVMAVSMERWIKQYDFMVADTSGKYQSVSRTTAEKNHVFEAWAKGHLVNGQPVQRRSLDFIFGGCASTTNPAQRLSQFMPLDTAAVSSATGAKEQNQILKILYKRHCDIHSTFCVSTCEDLQKDLITEHEQVTRAIAVIENKLKETV